MCGRVDLGFQGLLIGLKLFLLNLVRSRDRVLDVLVAGCGTGEHSIGTARRFKNVKLLASDFSLASLAYANGPGAGGPPPTEDTVAATDYRMTAAVRLLAETHGGEDTPLYARGPGAQWLHGVLEQNTIFWVMQAAVNTFEPPPPPPPKRPWYKPGLPKLWPFGGGKDAPKDAPPEGKS